MFQSMRKIHALPTVTLGLFCLAVAGCSPVVATRGNLIQDTQMAKIEPGRSDRRDVQYALGSPTATATLDDNVWYYIGRRTEQTAFFTPETTEQRILRIRFDEGGVVQAMDEIDGGQARYVEPVDRSTPTVGRDIGFFEQLLGSINRPRKKKEEE